MRRNKGNRNAGENEKENITDTVGNHAGQFITLANSHDISSLDSFSAIRSWIVSNSVKIVTSYDWPNVIYFAREWFWQEPA